MSLGNWINSLSGFDHVILLGVFLIGVYFSKATLEALIEFYDNKKKHSKFRVRFRITPAVLLSLGFLYSLIFYHILDAMFGFIP
jgi:hypothetical protein